MDGAAQQHKNCKQTEKKAGVTRHQIIPKPSDSRDSVVPGFAQGGSQNRSSWTRPQHVEEGRGDEGVKKRQMLWKRPKL